MVIEKFKPEADRISKRMVLAILLDPRTETTAREPDVERVNEAILAASLPGIDPANLGTPTKTLEIPEEPQLGDFHGQVRDAISSRKGEGITIVSVKNQLEPDVTQRESFGFGGNVVTYIQDIKRPTDILWETVFTVRTWDGPEEVERIDQRVQFIIDALESSR